MSWAPDRRDDAPGHQADPPVGPFGVTITFVSLAFLLGGIVWPETAESLLRMLLVTLALGFAAARAYEALPGRTTHDSYSPFEGEASPRTPPAAPHGLRQLARALDAADDVRRARRTAVPWTVARTVLEEASRRLAEDHGLRLDDPTHHTRIRSLVSEPTWFLIRPRDPGASGDGGSVPLSRLGVILDDLERL